MQHLWPIKEIVGFNEIQTRDLQVAGGKRVSHTLTTKPSFFFTKYYTALRHMRTFSVFMLFCYKDFLFFLILSQYDLMSLMIHKDKYTLEHTNASIEKSSSRN